MVYDALLKEFPHGSCYSLLDCGANDSSDYRSQPAVTRLDLEPKGKQKSCMLGDVVSHLQICTVVAYVNHSCFN